MKNSLLLFLLFSAFGQTAWALGLAKPKLHSEVGQPLHASIALVGEAIDPEQLLISLASKEDYQRLGIEQTFSHYDLRFSLSESSPPSVIITSEKPVNEPFLHFAITVKNPQGSLVKAVTLLLPAPKKDAGQSVFHP